MTLVDSNDVCNDSTVFAVRELIDLSFSGSRHEAPTRSQLIQPAGIVNVSGFRIDDLSRRSSLSAVVLLCPLRSLRQPFVIHLAASGFIYEGHLDRWRL